MKTTIFMLIAMAMLFLSACKPISMMIAKKNGDFIQPEKENNQSIMSYCNEKNVNYDNLFIVKSEDNFASFIGKYKNIPGIFIFDKSKLLITTAFKSDCPWTMINLLNDTNLKTKLIQDTTIYFEIMANFKMINERSIKKDPDYYILCTWAKFAPKLTDALFETINKQKAEGKLDVCYVLLNMDLQESWDSKQ